MENILLFVLTVIIYSLVLSIVFHEKLVLCTPQVKRIALIALLALPINIGGNVFTIAGNATAEKSIYSIFSIYQKAGQDAFTVIGPLYQKAGQDAFTGVGLTYQQAGQDAFTGVGLTYQQAGWNATTILGLLYQKAEQDAFTGVGLTYQQAGRNATTILGLANQRADKNTGVLCCLAYQQAGQDALTLLGLVVYQRAETGAKVPIAIALYQRVGEKTRAFGAFSALTRD